ncbi:MAG: permease-like cell division protein FtsX [Candidatus Gracilibacteria bacterium]|jgi:cell division transport system permease protein
MNNKPSTLYLLKKGLKFSLSNIWRNKVLSLATIFVIAIIIFIFNIILSINFIAKDALTDLNKKVDLVLYLKDSTNEGQVQTMMETIRGLEGVEKITYTTKARALEQLKEIHPEIYMSFEKYNLGNPLPASFNIVTTDPKYQSAINTFLNQQPYSTYLSNVTTNDNADIMKSVLKNLLKVSNFTKQVIFWLIMTFVVGGALIILNALQITIFTRRQEILVMKLVGASRWFVKLPFIIESIIYSVLAVLLSFLMLFLLSKNLQIGYQNIFNYLFIELLVTVVLGIFSSMIAVHEHLITKDL